MCAYFMITIKLSEY